MPTTCAVRRHVDARAVSFAISVIANSQPIQKELSTVTSTCATAALQAASAINALLLACRASADSQTIKQKLQGADLQRFQDLMSYTHQALLELYAGPLKETLEVLVVMATQTLPGEDSLFFEKWALGIGMDTRPLAIHEEDERSEVISEPIASKPASKARRRASKNAHQVYAQERLDAIVTKAISHGGKSVVPKQGNGIVLILANTGQRLIQIAKFRGSMDQAQHLADEANQEIAKFEGPA